MKSKNVLILGSSSEISISIVKKLSSLKYNIYFISNKSVDVELLSCSNVELDFTNFDKLSRYFDLNDFSPFDGIVYAGGKGGVRPLKLNNDDFVQSMFHENVFTFFEIIRILLKKKLINEGASIVALSSVSSIKGLKSKTVYSSSKAALDAAIRGMASELSDRKIRVNSIQKGWVSSDMNLDFIQSNMAISENNDFAKQLLGVIEPEEIANLTSFLLSDDVKTLTGTNILLDGGYTL
jgi:NAD(P)-dependent dehydrogenase (short-subunit alcohol dehydrogenase family)